MEKTKLIKIFLVIVVTLMVALSATTVFAADNTTNFIDITNSSGNTSGGNTSGGNTNGGNTSGGNNTSGNNSNTNKSVNNATGNSITSNNVATNNGSSSYNTNANKNANKNANLPKTGIAETGSIICIVFALAVSSVYAFKKLRDYNI